MPPKYIGFFVFIFVVGTVLGLVIENQQLGPEHQSTLNALMSWQEIGSEESWGFWKLVAFIPTYFGLLWNAMLWNFAFITGPWIYIKWFIWTPLMAMFIWGIVITFVGVFQKVLT